LKEIYWGDFCLTLATFGTKSIGARGAPVAPAADDVCLALALSSEFTAECTRGTGWVTLTLCEIALKSLVQDNYRENIVCTKSKLIKAYCKKKNTPNFSFKNVTWHFQDKKIFNKKVGITAINLKL
jgi:hypothetical protein